MAQLHHGPCHQQGFGVVLIPHTVADAAGQRHHVLQGAGQLHSHDIRAGIHPEAVVHKGVLHREGSRLRHAGRHAAGGEPTAHLLGVGGAGQGGDGKGSPRLLLQYLAHPQVGIPLDALGRRHQQRTWAQQRSGGMGRLPHGVRRYRHYHQLRFRQADHIRRQAQLRRQRNALQPRVLSGPLHIRRLLRHMGPQGHRMSVPVQHQRQRRSPAAAAQYHRFHVTPPALLSAGDDLPGGRNLYSVIFYHKRRTVPSGFLRFSR